MEAQAPKIFLRPTAGDVVVCRFPFGFNFGRQVEPFKGPGPKDRPALVLRVLEPAPGSKTARVLVAYGGSRGTSVLPYEVEFSAKLDKVEFWCTGLHYDTKFNLTNTVLLPYNSEWFRVSGNDRYRGTPQIGELARTSIPRVQVAYAMAKQYMVRHGIQEGREPELSPA